MKIAATFAAALMASVIALPAGEPDVRELLKPVPPVSVAENGGALMAKLETVCSRREMHGYDFGYKDPDYLVDPDSLDAFMEEQSELVKVTREIIARKEFHITSEKLPDGMQCLTKACTAIRLQSLLSVKKGKWGAATSDLIRLSRFHRRMMESAESTSLVMMSVGSVWQDAAIIPQLIRQTSNQKRIRPLAAGYEPLAIHNDVFGGAIRAEMHSLLESFETARSGGEPLKKLLAGLQLVDETGVEWNKAFKKVKDGDPEPVKGIVDTLTNWEERVLEVLKDPPAAMQAQLQEIAKIDWQEHDRNFLRYAKATLETDRSTWARSQETAPQPQSFFSGILLKQAQAEFEVRQFWSKHFYKAAAISRLAKVSLALCVWQLDHGGTLPDRLEQLVPQCLSAIPVDPFDGKPVRYQKAGQRLWCVGVDLNDDIGQLKNLKDRAKDDDVMIEAGKPH
ncbi:MAG TPA: hypothetical protein VHM91_15995 [Verrucomicrobiales bacterium]|jgi:hypothetical protein|nr:hypothetical protein [Verrucomicrobiales bacterium]